MSQIPNSIGISAPIAPFDTEDIYPTHFAKYGKGGYFSVNTLDELNSYPAERLEEGSLAFVVNTDLPGEDGKFYLREGLTWKEIDVFNPVPEVDLSSLNILPPGEIAPEDIPEFLERVDRGSKYIVYVDPNHLNATDAKTNKGNSPLRPFKTIERACLEAARKSFKAGGSNLNPNDFTEKVSIYLAPATYYVNNGRGGVAEDNLFHVRQDASNLIFANKKWLIDRAYAAAAIEAYIDGLAGLTLEQKEGLKIACKRDLNIYISSIANDISLGGNINTVTSANTIKPNGVYISAYDTIDERQKTVSALNSIKSDIRTYVLNNTADTVGGVALSDIILEGDSNGTNRCIAVKDSVDTLLDILIDTLNITEYVAPALEDANRGTLELGFPDTGEPSDTNLQGFNSAYNAGIILPRGISIVGADLRKVVIRPKYVPNKNGEEGSSAIFRMTGANFFSGFTIKDKEGLEESHHKLSCFEFCDDTDLNEYYDKVATVFKDNKQFNLLFDSSNLILYNSLWVNRKLSELDVDPDKEPYKEALLKKIDQITYSISADLRDQTDRRFKKLSAEIAEEYTSSFTDKVTEAENYYSIIDYIYEVLVDVISNRAVVVEGGFINPSVPADATNPTNPCQEVQSIILNFLEILKDSLAGQLIVDAFSPNDVYANNDVESTTPENQIVGPLGTNTVDGASPYIFSASLRSVYGMNGIDGNGSVVSGFKSYLAAQFTVISIQKDTDAFYPIVNAGEVANKRYKGTRYDDFVGLEPRGDWRHFGYKVTDEAYAQLVSCFCIGPAVHYWADSGAEFSITNSTSNFGDVSIQAYGYVGQDGDGGAYVQDKDYTLLGVQPPKSISSSESSARTFTVGTVASISVGSTGTGSTMLQNNGSITLEREIDSDLLDPYTVKIGSRIYIRLPQSGEEELGFEELYATVTGVTNNNKTINVTFPNGLWPNPNVSSAISTAQQTLGRFQIITGSNLLIKRLIDIRSQEDRVHKLLIEAPTGSRGRPIENFIFRVKKTETRSQFPFEVDKVFYVAKSENYTEIVNGVEEIVENKYLVTLLGAYTNNEGVSELNTSYYPTLDLDFDPVSQVNELDLNPVTSPTYKNIDKVLEHLGFTSGQRLDLLDLSDTIKDLNTPILIEFNKPTTIRCGGQTWEYLGYYNYDTAIPQTQASQLGGGLNDSDKIALRLDKLQKTRYGGRIYATGLDEEGNSYVGTRITNTRTGEEIDSRLVGTEESLVKSYSKVNIVSNLNMVSGSNLRVYSGSELTIDSGSILKLGGVESQDAKASYIRTSLGADIRSPGFAQPATYKETSDEVSLQGGGNGFNYITPATLGQWRKDKRILSQREGITKIYVGSGWTSGGEAASPRSANASYYSRYWPEPLFPDVPISGNPGYPFSPLATLNDAAIWANRNLASTETAELFLTPGVYSINASFNCNVIIRGAYGSGVYGAPDDPTSSILFYKSISVAGDINAAGYTLLRDLRITGRLSILGTGESEISNVFFISPQKAYRMVYNQNRPENENFDTLGISPAEHLMRQFLDRRYRNIYERTINDFPVQEGSLSFVTNTGDTSLILKRNGELTLQSCLFYPQSITASTEGDSTGTMIQLDNSNITLNGISIRGQESWAVPRSIAGSELPNNPIDTGYSVLDATNSNSMYEVSYTSNHLGEFVSLASAEYYSFYGTSESFIGIRGRCNVSLMRSFNRVNNAPLANYQDDRNNIRLEKNHYDLVTLTNSDYGASNLGVRGDLDLTDSETFVNSLPTLGPCFSHFFRFLSPNSILTVVCPYRVGVQSLSYIPGFKGEFSYLFTRDSSEARNLLGSGIRMYGWLSSPIIQGTGCILNISGQRGNGESLWQTAGGYSSNPYTNTNARNVYTIGFVNPVTSSPTTYDVTTTPNYTVVPGTLIHRENEPYLSQFPVSSDTATGGTAPSNVFADKTLNGGFWQSLIRVYNFSVSTSLTI